MSEDKKKLTPYGKCVTSLSELSSNYKQAINNFGKEIQEFKLPKKIESIELIEKSNVFWNMVKNFCETHDEMIPRMLSVLKKFMLLDFSIWSGHWETQKLQKIMCEFCIDKIKLEKQEKLNGMQDQIKKQVDDPALDNALCELLFYKKNTVLLNSIKKGDFLWELKKLQSYAGFFHNNTMNNVSSILQGLHYLKDEKLQNLSRDITLTRKSLKKAENDLKSLELNEDKYTFVLDLYTKKITEDRFIQDLPKKLKLMMETTQDFLVPLVVLQKRYYKLISESNGHKITVQVTPINKTWIDNCSVGLDEDIIKQFSLKGVSMTRFKNWEKTPHYADCKKAVHETLGQYYESVPFYQKHEELEQPYALAFKWCMLVFYFAYELNNKQPEGPFFANTNQDLRSEIEVCESNLLAAQKNRQQYIEALQKALTNSKNAEEREIEEQNKNKDLELMKPWCFQGSFRLEQYIPKLTMRNHEHKWTGMSTQKLVTYLNKQVKNETKWLRQDLNGVRYSIKKKKASIETFKTAIASYESERRMLKDIKNLNLTKIKEDVFKMDPLIKELHKHDKENA